MTEIPVERVTEDGGLEWRLSNGRLHREDGPAKIHTNGSKKWLQNGELHRKDGPAIEYPDGYKAWYLNGLRHREDGPAIEDFDGRKSWCLNGVVFDKLSQITPELELKYPEFCRLFSIYQIMTR